MILEQDREKTQVGFAVRKNKHSDNLLEEKSTYFITIIAIFLFIICLSVYSQWLYASTKTVSSTLQPFLPIHAGEIHYSRIPQEYWEHRILMIKAMGFNSLSTYVMWNYHQISQGQFDFTTGNRDLAAFLTLAKKHQMKVLLRPGPYVCAQWDFGGLPPRILGIEGLEIRSANKLYEDEVKRYFSALAPIITPHLHSKGGPIVLLQIENELGYYKYSPEHMANLRKMWRDLAINIQFYYQQAYANWKQHYWPGAHIGLSGGTPAWDYHMVQVNSHRTNQTFIFGGELYSGWFTIWGEPFWAEKDIPRIKQKFNTLIQYNQSVSAYVAVGGTSFGLTAGANGFQPEKKDKSTYKPHLTSYDYDAPINEQGKATPKYYAIRSIFQEMGKNITEVPQAIPSMNIPSFTPSIKAHLFANLPEPILIKSNLTFFQSKSLKMYKQGIAIYEAEIEQGKYRFNITIHDFSIIYIDDSFVGTYYRGEKMNHLVDIQCQKKSCKLKILVEAMGHINFGKHMSSDKKGLLYFNEINRPSLIFLWNIYKIELKDNLASWDKKLANEQFPLLLSASFELNQTGDTFIDMSSYRKGYLWVNGVLLGRYWHRGPQQRLYCPGVWLKKGTNIIQILQLLHPTEMPITGHQTLKD